MKDDRKIRVGLIGCGSLGRWQHSRNLCAIDGADLVAVCDPHPEAAQALVGDLDVSPAVYQDYQEMLEDEALDAVVVVTPNDSHKAIALAAAQAGLHIFMEKPMALTLEECDAMAEAVEKAGVRFMMGYMRRHQPAFVRLKELVDAGTLGALRMAQTVRMQHIAPGGGADGWQYRRNSYGGLYSLYSHELDQLWWLLGDIASVEAVMNYAEDPKIEIEESVFIGLEFTSGAIASLGCTRGSPTGHFSFTVLGTEAAAMINDYGGRGPLRLCRHGGETEEITFPETNEYRDEMAYFITCLRQSVKPEPGVAEGRLPVQIGMASYEAANSGRRVSL